MRYNLIVERGSVVKGERRPTGPKVGIIEGNSRRKKLRVFKSHKTWDLDVKENC